MTSEKTKRGVLKNLITGVRNYIIYNRAYLQQLQEAL